MKTAPLCPREDASSAWSSRRRSRLSSYPLATVGPYAACWCDPQPTSRSLRRARQIHILLFRRQGGNIRTLASGRFPTSGPNRLKRSRHSRHSFSVSSWRFQSRVSEFPLRTPPTARLQLSIVCGATALVSSRLNPSTHCTVHGDTVVLQCFKVPRADTASCGHPSQNSFLTQVCMVAWRPKCS